MMFNQRETEQFEMDHSLIMGGEGLRKQGQASDVAANNTSLPSDSTVRSTPTDLATGGAQRTGRWTPDEKILFLYGLRRFGKGRWKKMSIYLPNRSLVQIKSHAQKVLKRLEAGENVFRRLEENYSLVDTLIVQAAKQRGTLSSASAQCTSVSTAAKRKRVTKKLAGHAVAADYPSGTSFTSSYTHDAVAIDSESGTGAVIAAAALCQLSSLGGWESSPNTSLQKSC
mmetsp:Transcript_86992/g.130439  ORF Transcript_86992/g.130439 Transcript_86992/m.130439 type:complete len:227 (+) Transcript_86992:86-766(+)